MNPLTKLAKVIVVGVVTEVVIYEIMTIPTTIDAIRVSRANKQMTKFRENYEATKCIVYDAEYKEV